MVREGRIGQVRAYCEGDVLNLFGLYVRWALLAGKTSPQGHNDSYQSLVEYIQRERQGRPHLGEFMDKWAASSRPMPMMVPTGLLPGLGEAGAALALDPALSVERGHLPSESVLG